MQVQIILILFVIVILNKKFEDEKEHDDEEDFNLQPETRSGKLSYAFHRQCH
jgi:hypothetical protein